MRDHLARRLCNLTLRSIATARYRDGIDSAMRRGLSPVPLPDLTDVQWVGAMMSGDQFWLYGRRVRATLEWIDPSPFGDDEKTREQGRKMRDCR